MPCGVGDGRHGKRHGDGSLARSWEGLPEGCPGEGAEFPSVVARGVFFAEEAEPLFACPFLLGLTGSGSRVVNEEPRIDEGEGL